MSKPHDAFSFKPRRKFDVLRRIEQLDPEHDAQEIVYLVGAYENPFLIRKALEFALFRTYAVPAISRLLNATGQFAGHGQKRYDDTALIIAMLAEYGYESDEGRKAIALMNYMHGRYNIGNNEMLYVLSTFIYEPVRWNQRYGWRKPTRRENLANYYFWCEVGRRMGITAIPASYEAFEAFNIAYEAAHFRYADSNHRVGTQTVNIFLNWFPAVVQPIVREGLYAMMDDPLLQAFGFPKPSGVMRLIARGGLWLLGRIKRFTPPRRTPYSLLREPNRTYPDGFDIDAIMPPGAVIDGQDGEKRVSSPVPTYNGHTRSKI